MCTPFHSLYCISFILWMYRSGFKTANVTTHINLYHFLRTTLSFFHHKNIYTHKICKQCSRIISKQRFRINKLSPLPSLTRLACEDVRLPAAARWDVAIDGLLAPESYVPMVMDVDVPSLTFTCKSHSAIRNCANPPRTCRSATNS